MWHYRAVQRSALRTRSRSACRALSAFRDEYLAHVAEREQQGIVPKPLDPKQCAALVEELKAPVDDADFLKDLLSNRVPPGVDEATIWPRLFL